MNLGRMQHTAPRYKALYCSLLPFVVIIHCLDTNHILHCFSLVTIFLGRRTSVRKVENFCALFPLLKQCEPRFLML